MIHAVDLRIGNLVSAFTPYPIEVVVETIGYEGINLSADREGFIQYDYEFTWLYGIPLTAEWLERFAFINESAWFFRNDKLVIEAFLSKNKWDARIRISPSDSIWLREIRYVHELMNLHYALTNTELTLK